MTLEVIKPWENNPNFYLDLANAAIFSLIARAFAPIHERLRLIITREQLILNLLQSALCNIYNPPAIFTEMADENISTVIQFFENDLPDLLKQCNDISLKNQFEETNKKVINALQTYQTWLKTSLLASSKGDFRIGAETYRNKLMYVTVY